MKKIFLCTLIIISFVSVYSYDGVAIWGPLLRPFPDRMNLSGDLSNFVEFYIYPGYEDENYDDDTDYSFEEQNDTEIDSYYTSTQTYHWVEFWTLQGEQISITMFNSNSLTDYDIELHDDTQNNILADGGYLVAGEDETIDYTATYTGQYWLMVGA
ncbi:MAG: hypothetical protein Q7J16_00850 [Candidatus Cloacimonadales bacterium]|nr:hypothetical protein [Candidatus Cloacimonadales bacterium]